MKKILRKLAEIDAVLLTVMEEAALVNDREMFDKARAASTKVYFLYVDVHKVDELKKKKEIYFGEWFRNRLSLLE